MTPLQKVKKCVITRDKAGLTTIIQFYTIDTVCAKIALLCYNGYGAYMYLQKWSGLTNSRYFKITFLKSSHVSFLRLGFLSSAEG